MHRMYDKLVWWVQVQIIVVAKLMLKLVIEVDICGLIVVT